MSEWLEVAELAEAIYSQCGVVIKYDDCQAIAQKLIELGYKKSED